MAYNGAFQIVRALLLHTWFHTFRRAPPSEAAAEIAAAAAYAQPQLEPQRNAFSLSLSLSG